MKLFKSTLFVFLFLTTFSSWAAKVDTLTIQSAAMNKTWRVGVVVPQSYKKAKMAFPVLYLLHGYSGNFRDWLTKTPDKELLHRMADKYNMIIVTPDGGFSSWYLDSPLDKETQFETFITKELVDRVDKDYRTVKTREGRFISGLSMGGHGALYLSARHPQLYSAAGSMSGALDISGLEAKNLNQSIEKLLGPKEQNLEKFKANSMVYLADQLKANDVKIFIDCGVDDFLIESNRELHRRLVYNKTPHEYIERPGAHTWPYWGYALEYHLLFYQKVREGNSPLPPASAKK
ncbi:alpha/beta hydrolase [Adhaeribacter rhizoryzae]|uniref:Esterase family protein n=1 Tax=Adhaeribacter rhizoryzae TaxID=2607907 RepID=A0A5M6D5U0_9BACT|nr:alpha/beta hydrolase family protein [Adhaeribacter rhizoryzae]KAA5542874.1 esterase family protein [Adhaeribacter rhizoryzae]